MDLRKKIALLGMLQLVVVSGVLFWLYARQANQNARQQYVEKARSVILTVESTREEMGRKWEQDLFTVDQLRTWAQADEHEKILAAIPVVTAWRSAMAKAEEGGYSFRVPKFHPRNPANEPDELEARVLRMFQESGKTEHYEIDESINAIRYFRPVRLTDDCMACHGDPATSAQLWGNDQGLDPTGARMENWKSGEVHGAFEVVQSLDAADAAIAASIRKAAVLVGGMIILGMGLFFYFANRGINGLYRPIRQIAGTLDEGAHQVADAAHQIAHASQSLACGASDQASSLEQTSAALEEMAAVTNTSADKSRQANELAGQAHTAANRSGEVVVQLNQAMQGISESSGQITAIVKAIEEIAFQTNLLALNAAVEAARAGEHGKGFAVVADEVRSLAQRAGQAASEIGELNVNATASSQEGVRTAAEVSTALTGIISNVQDVAGLIADIANASSEQAEGINQINAAVNQMDSVTQQNAASAEESASASEQLSAQADSVQSMVRHLLELVGAGKNRSENLKSDGQRRRPPAISNTAAAPPARQKTRSTAHKARPRPAQTTAGSAQDFIPLTADDDLSRF